MKSPFKIQIPGPTRRAAIAALAWSALAPAHAHAYTAIRCEADDRSKVVNMTFDRVADLLVIAKLKDRETEYKWKLTFVPTERPLPWTPERPEMEIVLGPYIFHLSRDAESASLTMPGEPGIPMLCCPGIIAAPCKEQRP